MPLMHGDVYQLARAAGLPHAAAVTATAVAAAESAFNPTAIGDEALADAKWGPSIGLWQIRSLRADQDTGRSRDASRLKDPTFNARSMATISRKGDDFTAWTMYTNGAYRAHVGLVEQAVAGKSLTAPKPNRGNTTSTATQVGLTFPKPSLPDLPDLPGGFPGLPDVLGGITGAPGKLADAANPFPELIAAATLATIYGAALALGGALIVVGVWRAVS